MFAGKDFAGGKVDEERVVEDFADRGVLADMVVGKIAEIYIEKTVVAPLAWPVFSL